jgi:hypothetical protein
VKVKKLKKLFEEERNQEEKLPPLPNSENPKKIDIFPVVGKKFFFGIVDMKKKGENLKLSLCLKMQNNEENYEKLQGVQQKVNN